MAGATIAVNIVSSERPVWSGEAKQVVGPAYAGGMGILPGHEPVLSVIEEGRLDVTDPNGKKFSFEVTGGFISFDSNKLTVAVENARSIAFQAEGADQSGIVG